MLDVAPAATALLASPARNTSLRPNMTTPDVQDSRVRSLLKGITWRAGGTATTVAVSWFITGDISAAMQIGFLEVFAKIGIYYLHERAWAQIPHGTFSTALIGLVAASRARLRAGKTRGASNEIRHFLRTPAAAGLGRTQRAQAAERLSEGNRARGQTGLRLCLGGGASLPGRVFPFLGARGLPGRRQPADEEHPARPRHHPAHHQSSGPGGGEGGPRWI